MRSDKERIEDIIEAIEKIERYSGRGKQALETDEMFQVWVTRHLQIIGEAANLVSIKVQNRYPNIPWKKNDRHAPCAGTWVL